MARSRTLLALAVLGLALLAGIGAADAKKKKASAPHRVRRLSLEGL
jgi:hypothetical protein